MWSLGCVIAELFLGWPLYPGASEYDQVGPGGTGVHDKHSFSIGFALHNVTCGWVYGVLCRFPSLASLNLAFFFPLFHFSLFHFVLLSFLIMLSFFSKALEPLVYRVCSDRKSPDFILIFSCRFGISHKHRVCQRNIY